MTAPTVDAAAELSPEEEAKAETAASGATGTLSLDAPDGAKFEEEEVKTARGTKSLGNVPMLIWEDLEKAVTYYGEDGIKDVLDGTSLRVSFQNIGRRFATAGKTKDEIAQAQINFRPGKRVVGPSTPASRAGNAARRAAEKLGDRADDITSFLERLAKGEVPQAQLDALLGK